MSLIHNTNKVKQSIDFTNIEWGNIHPSDIDAVLEFNNEVLILIEVKQKGKEIPTGQKLMLERISDSWHTKKSIVLLVWHDFNNENMDIPLNKCIIEKVYFESKWTSKKEKLKPYLDKIKKYYKIEK
jgi:hypothetical protein